MKIKLILLPKNQEILNKIRKPKQKSYITPNGKANMMGKSSEIEVQKMIYDGIKKKNRQKVSLKSKENKKKT